MIYENRHSIWFCPGWKIEQGETPADALKREVREELWVEVTHEKFLWWVKTVHKGKIFRMHYFEITIAGTPMVQEPDKHGKIAWVQKVAAENSFGYVLKADDLVITDEQQLRHEFRSFHFIEQGLFAHRETWDAPICILPWTTTPWTLPANMFAAVHNDIRYVELYDLTEKCYFILAEACIEKYYKSPDQYIHVLTLSGRELVGLWYTPLFPYYQNNPTIADTYKAQVHHVLHADFVTTESGTWVVHEAPAFGVDDYDLICTIFPKDQAQERLFDPVNVYGEFTDAVPDFAGHNVFEANALIIKDLKSRGLLVKQETINHSYPHCPRTGTPMIYKAIESRFVKEEELKAVTIPGAQQIHFVPETVKQRFINGLETAPDRNISRTRFWWCPLPVRACKACDATVVCGSIAEIEQRSGKTVTDLHRPYIDEITFPCACGATMQRIPEVLDCRFESGSMPYGQDHWMKKKCSPLEEGVALTKWVTGECEWLTPPPFGHLPFPGENNRDGAFSNCADFIAEGLDQTRGRFRALHVLWHAYHGQNVFRNVAVTGMILAEDGKKMSKRLKNYPDPSYLLNQYGADPLRLYLLSSPVVRAEPLRFSEKTVEQMLKDVIIPLQNVSNFLQMYAEVDQRKHPGTQVWFMRHAIKQKMNIVGETDTWWITAEGETIEDIDLPLAEEGFAQLTSPEFIEQVVRINPDIIVTSDFLRAQQTAEGVQKVLQDYLWKDVEIVATTDRGLWVKREDRWNDCNTFVAWEDTADAKPISQVYAELLEKYPGKRVLVVSHKRRFRYLWQWLCNLREDINTTEAGRQYFIESAECVPLPLTPLHNELDQWIFAELHQTIVTSDALCKAYNIESATKVLLTLVDKLTNRWVRRSRRRFWAPGMEADKQQAYTTLYCVLHIYLRAMAPIMPFTTESIWQTLASLTTSPMGAHPSIHTDSWPLWHSIFINKQLIDEVQQVREIITGALYLRAKQQIKIKQPLQSLSVRLLKS